MVFITYGWYDILNQHFWEKQNKQTKKKIPKMLTRKMVRQRVIAFKSVAMLWRRLQRTAFKWQSTEKGDVGTKVRRGGWGEQQENARFQANWLCSQTGRRDVGQINIRGLMNICFLQKAKEWHWGHTWSSATLSLSSSSLSLLHVSSSVFLFSLLPPSVSPVASLWRPADVEVSITVCFVCACLGVGLKVGGGVGVQT